MFTAMELSNSVAWVVLGFLGSAVFVVGSLESNAVYTPGKYVVEEGFFPVFPVRGIPVEPIDPMCEKLINSFTDASSNYTTCMIQHAVSYKLCQACVDDYVQVGIAYRLLTQKQNNSRICTETFPGMLEVKIFINVYNFVTNSWGQSGCENCFAWYKINSTSPTPDLSNATKKFLSLSLDFYLCIFNESFEGTYLPGTDTPLLWLRAHQNGSNVTTCERCKNAYEALNGFYVANFETIYDRDDKAYVICYDVAGSMNSTRYIWQSILNCPMLRASVWPIIVASVLLCCFPVAFYVATKIFGQDIKPRVVPSKRYRGSVAPQASNLSNSTNHMLHDVSQELIRNAL